MCWFALSPLPNTAEPVNSGNFYKKKLDSACYVLKNSCFFAVGNLHPRLWCTCSEKGMAGMGPVTLWFVGCSLWTACHPAKTLRMEMPLNFTLWPFPPCTPCWGILLSHIGVIPHPWCCLIDGCANCQLPHHVDDFMRLLFFCSDCPSSSKQALGQQPGSRRMAYNTNEGPTCKHHAHCPTTTTMFTIDHYLCGLLFAHALVVQRLLALISELLSSFYVGCCLAQVPLCVLSP